MIKHELGAYKNCVLGADEEFVEGERDDRLDFVFVARKSEFRLYRKSDSNQGVAARPAWPDRNENHEHLPTNSLLLWSHVRVQLCIVRSDRGQTSDDKSWEV